MQTPAVDRTRRVDYDEENDSGGRTMDKRELLRSKKLYLFDMDGTLYLGNRLYEFTLELLETLRKSGRKYLFMTNNSSKSVEDYVKKLEKLGISATREDFMTSSQATA